MARPAIGQNRQSRTGYEGTIGQGAAHQNQTPDQTKEAPAERWDRWVRKQEAQRETVGEALKRAREAAEEQREALDVEMPQRYGDAPLEAYARLAKARNVQEVSSAAGYVRRQIARLQAALGQDPDNADAIRSALAQLRKAVNRCSRKKKDLQREMLLEQQRRRAQERQCQREMLRLKAEVQRRKKTRFIREGAYLQEAAIENQMQAYIAQTKAEMDQQIRQVAPASPVQGHEAISGEGIGHISIRA